MKIGFTSGTFDLMHAGHVLMFQECKTVCDYLIVAIQNNPHLDRAEKNEPAESIIERQIKVKGCRYVDETIVYETEADLEILLNALDIDIRIVGGDYKSKPARALEVCHKRNIEIYYNKRDHDFSSSSLRERIKKL